MAGLFLDAPVRILMFEGGWLPARLEGYDLVGLPLYPLTISVYLIFLLRQAWIKTGEIRWFALSWMPFTAILLVRRIPVVARHVDPVWSDLLYITTGGFVVVGVGFVLLRRSGRLRSERDRLHSEMLAAQQIQRLLLPAQSVTISGLQVDTVYLPAQEVGGDFFQVAKTRDGSLLLIMGDVSGKGLKAALTVSLIVGLWQEMMDGSEQSPQCILSRLNQQLMRRLSEGFVTCLCVRLSADGTLTLANAGHLAPYVNGQELVTANGLPLGLSAEVEYSETQHVLAPGDTLTLISDGVVEARDKSRNLFGFERLQQVLSEHLEADALARRAQQFGQEDDITVISIARQAVGVQPLPQGQAAATAV
jgi:hypothetical protein